eukprot:TRINITY_DN2879_c0_g1_i2.p1 TRINITY_DN2879_c0_g1~~TRINITY_DN2879_c0_g1_i2.p1  ORF type:complete len:426 (-),score=54.80 TRINITY_DN2879_c0_g1_i2:417-1694(-)
MFGMMRRRAWRFVHFILCSRRRLFVFIVCVSILFFFGVIIPSEPPSEDTMRILRDRKVAEIMLMGAFKLNEEKEHVGERPDFKVMTYNIWNYHSYWELRSQMIADMIQSEYPDVIVLQEVRRDTRGGVDQLSDLATLLPSYMWKIYEVASPQVDEFYEEGLGILSRRPIVNYHVKHFQTVRGDPDTNSRISIHAEISTQYFRNVNIFVAHLSYDKKVQCRNVMELSEFVDSFSEPSETNCHEVSPRIIAGDFNTYIDFETPMTTFQGSNTTELQCSGFKRKQGLTYRDVWLSLKNESKTGLTFSLMPFKDAEHNVPSEGLESRPDRVFLASESCVLKETSIKLIGNGTEYKNKFRDKIMEAQKKAGFRESNPDDFFPSDHLGIVATFENGSGVNLVEPERVVEEGEERVPPPALTENEKKIFQNE